MQIQHILKLINYFNNRINTLAYGKVSWITSALNYIFKIYSNDIEIDNMVIHPTINSDVTSLVRAVLCSFQW